MSEARALIFLFVGVVLFSSAAGVVLALTHASGTVYGLTIGLGAALGGWVAGSIVVRYARLEERKKREEIILSR